MERFRIEKTVSMNLQMNQKQSAEQLLDSLKRQFEDELTVLRLLLVESKHDESRFYFPVWANEPSRKLDLFVLASLGLLSEVDFYTPQKADHIAGVHINYFHLTEFALDFLKLTTRDGDE